MAAQPAPHHQFKITVTKTMLPPWNQLTLPAKVDKSLGLSKKEIPSIFFTVSPYHNYEVELRRQKHPGDGWRSTKLADWKYLTKDHRICEGEELVFTQVDHLDGLYYTVRSPRLDAANVAGGITPAIMFVPPTWSDAEWSGEDEDGDDSEGYEVVEVDSEGNEI